MFKNKQEAAVWAWICDMARFRAHTFRTQFGMVTLERGQLLLSQRKVAEEFGLGRQQVRSLMSRLVAASMIFENSTHSASRAGTIITVVNYEKYQSDNGGDDEPPTQEQPKAQPKTNPRATQGQPTREEREEREERKEVVEEIPAESLVGAAALPAIDHVHDAQQAYQQLRREIVTGGHRIAFDSDRLRKLAARLREVGPNGWAEALSNIRDSSFLRGETSRTRKFVAEIDWLLEPKNLRKVLEGNYNDGRPASTEKRSSVRGSPIDALSHAIAASGLGG
ncbi:MAG: hypothetical protein ABIV36_24345 [Sphingobium limneticum]